MCKIFIIAVKRRYLNLKKSAPLRKKLELRTSLPLKNKHKSSRGLTVSHHMKWKLLSTTPCCTMVTPQGRTNKKGSSEFLEIVECIEVGRKYAPHSWQATKMEKSLAKKVYHCFSISSWSDCFDVSAIARLFYEQPLLEEYAKHLWVKKILKIMLLFVFEEGGGGANYASKYGKW